MNPVISRFFLLAGAAALGGALATAPACDGTQTTGTTGSDAAAADLAITDAGPQPDAGGGADGGAMPQPLKSSSAYKWSIPDTPPTPNAQCKAPTEADLGSYYEWDGFTYDGTTFTCNFCPKGQPDYQGAWRAIFDRQGDDPTIPYDKDPTYREKLEIHGNAFTWTMDGDDLGKNVHAVVKGWYWCGSKPEVYNESRVFVVTSVEPEGAFGWDKGLVTTADVLYSDPNGLLYNDYGGFVTDSGDWVLNQPYCRIGLQYGGKACVDPFAN